MPTFRSQLLHALAAAAGTVAAALIGSFFGTAGTLIGLALGASVAAVATHLAEQALTRAHQAAVSREWFTRQRGRPPTPVEETQIHVAARAVSRGVPWKRLGLFAAGLAVAGLAVITVIEVGAGKPVADVVTGHPGRGTTITGPVHADRHHPAPRRSKVETPVAPTTTQATTPPPTAPQTPSSTPSSPPPTSSSPPAPSPTTSTAPTATTSGIP